MNPRFLLAVALFIIWGTHTQTKNHTADFCETAKVINNTIRAHHYHPRELESDVYRQIEKDVLALGSTAESVEEFVTGFNRIWQEGPFSHVRLWHGAESAKERYARLDTMTVGDDAVTLKWEGKAAILTVNTMSGADTIENIEATYGEISARKAVKLIIDLRRNTGGAFAVVPLLGHLISDPIDAGVFVTQMWYDNHNEPPEPADLYSAIPRSQGYSVQAFQSDMLS